MPTTSFLRRSLALWRRRTDARKTLHTTAQQDLEHARAEDVHPQQPLVDRRNARTAQLTEARKMAAKRAEQIHARAAAAKRHGPAAALEEARRYIGKTEQPAGSNTAPWGLGAWIEHFLGLHYGVAWCGIFVGHCLQEAGVPVTGRVASVRAIYEDARAGRNGFARLVPKTEGRGGDVLILFTLDTHTELVEKRVPGGYQTIGGNTSPGATGSQANGGGCFRRIRPDSAVVAVCRPAYPTKGT